MFHGFARPSVATAAAGLIFVATTLALAPAAAAQDALPGGTTLVRGARVRVTAPGIPERLEARVDTVRNDTLRLNAGESGYVVAIPLLSVRRVEIPAGPGSRMPRALAGTAVGLASGGLLGFQVAAVLQNLYPDCADCEYEPLPSEKREWRAEDRRLRWVWAAGVGAAAGIVGGIVGSRREPGERWRDVSLPVRVSIAPTRDGALFGVGVTIR